MLRGIACKSSLATASLNAHLHSEYFPGAAMRRLTILLLGFLASVGVQQQVFAQAEKPKPEDVLRKMAEYLGNLPGFACRMEATIDIKPAHEEPVQQVTKM